jgi:hypothetical protein
MADIPGDVINRFKPISLAEMECVKLLTRNDQKYVFHISRLGGFLEKALPDFLILENNRKRIHGYETHYWDTPGFEMYLNHHNGKLDRYKIRFREYIDSHEFFFEVKLRQNKGNIRKMRIPISPPADFTQSVSRDFLADHSCYRYHQLEPKICSKFDRITLVNKGMSERVTIDIHPSWIYGDRCIQASNVVISEVKSLKPSHLEGFSQVLHASGIQPFRMSKYCIGTTLLFPEIKHNRFKAKILHLKKLDHT